MDPLPLGVLLATVQPDGRAGPAVKLLVPASEIRIEWLDVLVGPGIVGLRPVVCPRRLLRDGVLQLVNSPLVFKHLDDVLSLLPAGLAHNNSGGGL